MPSVEILLPVGRIVAGHPRRPRKQMEDDGRTPRLRDGKEIMQYGFGFAIPKADFPPVAAAMGQAAAGIEGNNRPDFAWKVKDGDTGLDGDGKPLRDKEGYAGCMVMWISTEIENLIKVFAPVDATSWREMSAEEINTGDYVQPKIVIEGHGKKPGVANSKPGLYLNPQGIQFVGYGQRILSGVDPAAMFGSAPRPALPPGASATPLAPTGSAAAPMPSAAGPSFAAPGAPAAAPVPFPGAPSPVPAAAPAPSFAPAPVAAAPAPLAPAPATFTPSPGPQPAPSFAPVAAAPAPSPAAFAPAPTASPSSPVMPAHDFVQSAQRQPIGFDPNNGRPIYGYQPGTNRPIYGYDPSGQWPILGFDPAGNPLYQ